MGEPQSQVQDKASADDGEEEEEETGDEANRAGSTNGNRKWRGKGEEIEERRGEKRSVEVVSLR
jgi:hypothetical protein